MTLYLWLFILGFVAGVTFVVWFRRNNESYWHRQYIAMAKSRDFWMDSANQIVDLRSQLTK